LSDIILREANKYPLHAASVGLEKNGKILCIAIIAPTGTGKTTQFHELFV
jgi:hypothetical protein